MYQSKITYTYLKNVVRIRRVMFGTLSSVLCREVLETIILCPYLGGSPIESYTVVKAGLLPQILCCTCT